MKKLIAGNWKMNGSLAAARMLANAVIEGLEKEKSLSDRCDILICPPFVHLGVACQALDHKNAPLWLGAQDCSERENGAVTGDISAAMLRDCGVRAVILGHSERRQPWIWDYMSETRRLSVRSTA